MIDPEATRARLAALLAAESTLVLSTAGPAGPAGAPLFYLPEPGLRVVWLSSPRSRHSRNLAADPRAAISVFARTFHWEAIRGAQLDGTAAIVEDATERAALLAAYRARFSLGPSFDAAIEASRVYRFVPRRARLIDNALGFPGRVEIELEPSAA